MDGQDGGDNVKKKKRKQSLGAHIQRDDDMGLSSPSDKALSDDILRTQMFRTRPQIRLIPMKSFTLKNAL